MPKKKGARDRTENAAVRKTQTQIDRDADDNRDLEFGSQSDDSPGGTAAARQLPQFAVLTAIVFKVPRH